MKKYRATVLSCYIGYVTQAIVNNLAPLLFVIFQNSFAISFEQLGRLVLVNFATQVIVDYLAGKVADKVGYRKSMVFAHLMAAAGLAAISILPRVMTFAPYLGLVIACVMYGIGGGLLEVLVSPIIENLPSENKASAMSLLHSFYCWGQMAVVLVSTLLLKFAGEGIWWLLPLLWAIVPVVNAVRFAVVPLPAPVPEEVRADFKTLLRSRTFLIALVIMVCAGASELTMSQWSSTFAELGLGIPKIWGDLLGPCLFAFFMALGRTAYGIWGEKLDIVKALAITGGMCCVCYLTAVLASNPVLSLLGCALCGFSVSLMWPGATSMTAAKFPNGGTCMFALLAFSGDIGCSSGPWLTGLVSDIVSEFPGAVSLAEKLGVGMDGLALKAGLLVGTLFPLVLLVCLVLFRRHTRETAM